MIYFLQHSPIVLIIVMGKKFNCLKELEIYYENELIQLDEEENIKNALKNVINNYEEIFENKKPRKTKMKKKDL